MTKRALTGEEALAILAKQREYRRKIAAGYAAAKKAGLI